MATKIKSITTRNTPFPGFIKPMLCTKVASEPTDERYLFEVKWDGYRILSYVQDGKVSMKTRGDKDYAPRYPPLVKALKALGKDAVLDGEVVVFDEQGRPNFNGVQLYNGQDTPITYCVFDLLWLDGKSLMDQPLEERKKKLKTLLKGNKVLLYSDSFDDGPALMNQMKARAMEGIVAKRRDSRYLPGDRGDAWLKIPIRQMQEFVIGGWAESDKRAFKSLLFGAYMNGQLTWIGRSGGGFKEREMAGILKHLQKLETKQSPFVNPVLDTGGAVIHWIKPKAVANFQYAELILYKDGKPPRIRKPATFLGFRGDKKSTDVVLEIARPTPGQPAQEEPPAPVGRTSKKVKFPTSADSNWPKIESQPIAEREDFDFGDCTISVTNYERHLWKDVTKLQLIDYYHTIAPVILLHLKDRPQSPHIKLGGASAPGFYQKDMEGRQPDCATIFTDKRKHAKTGARPSIDYLVCNNEATLLWLINLGCIDVNPWMARMQRPDQPDFVNIDLDPTDNDFSKVIETTKAAKQVLDQYELKAYPKTSGKTGMHIYIPVTGIRNSQARAISTHLCDEIHQLVPSITTRENDISRRASLLYVDNSQNDYADTLAAAYSVRPTSTPTVSTPLEWREIKPSLHPAAFTFDKMTARLKKKGDLFAPTLDSKVATNNYKQLVKIGLV